MKKVLMGVTAAALAAVMCVGFVACGGDSAESLAEDAEKIVSDKVTAEQWQAAFAQKNFENVEAKQVYIYKGGTEGEKDWAKQTSFYTYSCNGANAYVKYSEKLEGAFKEEAGYADYEGEAYWTVRDGQMIEIYQEEDGKWFEGNSENYDGLTYIGAIFTYSFSDSYESFTYSEEEKGYLMEDSEDSDSQSNVIFKFQNGKLAVFIQRYSYDNIVNNVTMTFTYGGQKEVTLPKVSE